MGKVFHALRLRGDLAFALCIERSVCTTVVDPAPLRFSAYKTKLIFSLASRMFRDEEVGPSETLDDVAPLDPCVCQAMDPYTPYALRTLTARRLASMNVPFTSVFPT